MIEGRSRHRSGKEQPLGLESGFMNDVEAIKHLKARSFRTVDTKDWAGYRQVFADDVVIDVTEEAGGEPVHGADVFLEFIEATLSNVVTVHQGHMPEIEITSATTAKGIWALNDILKFADGSNMEGWGHYHETYEKVGDEWKIKSLRLTRLRVDFTPAPDAG